MGAFSASHLIIILVIILLLFGAKKVPELAKGLGTGMHEFRKEASGEIGEEKDSEKGSESLASDDSRREDDIRAEDESSSEKANKTQQRS